MLGNSTIGAMVGVTDQAAGDMFFGGTLGLEKITTIPGGTLYKSGSGRVFVYETPNAGTNQATTAFWDVEDVVAAVEELQEKGVAFEHYEIPGVSWDGDIASIDDMKIAWFKDPDGNIFQISSNGRT